MKCQLKSVYFLVTFCKPNVEVQQQLTDFTKIDHIALEEERDRKRREWESKEVYRFDSLD